MSGPLNKALNQPFLRTHVSKMTKISSSCLFSGGKMPNQTVSVDPSIQLDFSVQTIHCLTLHFRSKIGLTLISPYQCHQAYTAAIG